MEMPAQSMVIADFHSPNMQVQSETVSVDLISAKPNFSDTTTEARL
jgi:hypothetical protein